MSFIATDSPSHEGNTNTWLTPLPLIRALGEFDLDPCGFPGHETANRLICLPEDGFTAEWQGRVWLNPPYGREIGKWIKKLEEHGNGIALIFTRTDTSWFQDLNPDAIFLLAGRIKFLKSDFTISTNAGTGSMLICYGDNNIAAVMRSGLKGKLVR
jgi:hypothetical protein